MRVDNLKNYPQFRDDGWERLQEVYPEMVYIGRGNARKGLPQSPLHNPFRIGKDGNREEVIQKYRRHLYQLVVNGKPDVMNALAQISESSILMCWCAPQPCHGDVIIRCVGWLAEAYDLAGITEAG